MSSAIQCESGVRLSEAHFRSRNQNVVQWLPIVLLVRPIQVAPVLWVSRQQIRRRGADEQCPERTMSARRRYGAADVLGQEPGAPWWGPPCKQQLE